MEDKETFNAYDDKCLKRKLPVILKSVGTKEEVPQTMEKYR